DGIVEDCPRIIAVVPKCGLEETAEPPSCRGYCAHFIVKAATAEERDADAHPLEALAWKGSETICRDRHVVHSLDECRDAIGDQSRLTADEQCCIDVARPLSFDEIS